MFTHLPIWFAHGREFRGIGIMTTDMKRDLVLNYTYRDDDKLGNFLFGKVADGLKNLSEPLDERVKDDDKLAGITTATGREKNTVTGKLMVPEKIVVDWYKNLK